MLRGFALSSAIYAAGSFASKFAKFLLIPIYVRYLSPDEVGTVVFLEALTLACARLFPLALGQAIKRFYIDFPDRRLADCYANTLWLTTLGLAVIGALLLSGLAALAPGLVSANVPAALVVLAIVIGAVRTTQALPLQRFIARGEAPKYGLYSLGEFLTTTSLIILLVVGFRQGVLGVLFGQLASYVIWAFVYGVLLGSAAEPYARRDHIAESLRYSIPLVPHLLFTWAITFADRLVLERFVPLAELGVYGIGYQLASVMPILSLAMINAWLPRYFKAASRPEGGPEYCRTFAIVSTALALLAATLYFGAQEIIILAVTEKYAGAVEIFRIVAVGLIFHGVYQSFLLILFFTKDSAWVSTSTGIALAVNLLVLFVFVPAYGGIAAAWATVAAYVTASIYTFWRARDRLLGASRADLRHSLAPVAAGTASLLAVHFTAPADAGAATRLALWLGVVTVTVAAGFIVQRKFRGHRAGAAAPDTAPAG